MARSYKNYDWLADIVGYLDVEPAGEWLSEENPRLSDRSPLQCVADGDQEAVAALVDRMIDDGESED